MLLRRAVVLLLCVAAPEDALAQSHTTVDALARFEERVANRVEDQGLKLDDLFPILVVSVQPAYEESRASYPVAAIQSLGRAFGTPNLRLCEACMAPRLHLADGRVEQNASSPTTEELVRLDTLARGTAKPARTAVWLDETPSGVALRLISLDDSRILMAENFDPRLLESLRSIGNSNYLREVERRARGDSITHTLFDISAYPGPHVSLDILEQWGDTNRNLSGFSFSFWDPVGGVGAGYHRVVPEALNISVGVKVLVSVPTALATALSSWSDEGTTDLIDPLFTGVFVARVPLGRSNFAATLTLSTNGGLGLGITLLDPMLLPFLP